MREYGECFKIYLLGKFLVDIVAACRLAFSLHFKHIFSQNLVIFLCERDSGELVFRDWLGGDTGASGQYIA